MMVMPSGRRSSVPGPVAMTSGMPANKAAIVVIRIGRKRARHASKIASADDRPRLRSASSAKSTIMMPFFLTMPINRMMPTKAITVSGVFVTCSASSAPRPADGNVEMIVIGCARLS